MHTSTPVVITKPRNLRKAALLRDAANSVSSNKRRLSNIINQSLKVQIEVDDELERSLRRSEAEIQKRLSFIGSPKSPQVVNDKEIHDHFQVCLKMFAENKINTKNAWNLKIIDYMRNVLYASGSLQMAGTSLDVSAKVYGVRVDDIHSEVVRLSHVITSADKNPVGDNEEQEEEENEIGTTKKRKKRHADKKATIIKDLGTLLGDLPKLESVFFQTHINIESSANDNLFTNKLPMDYNRYKFMFLSDEKAWPSFDKKDYYIDRQKKNSFKLPKLKNFEICAPLVEFDLCEWNPDQENLLSSTEKPAAFDINEEVVFDAEGIPIPELDGSIHDVFANDAGGDNSQSSEEEENNKVGQDAVLTKRVAHILDFKPGNNGLQADEYSYSNAINLNSGKLMTQVWAGPSHWKLKHVRRITSRFSGQPEKQGIKTTKKTKILPTLIDFDSDEPPIDKTKLYRPKRVRIDESLTKSTLPQVVHFSNSIYRCLMLKPAVYLRIDNLINKDGEDPQVKPYNYDNPNDSMYCSQIGIDNGCNDDDEQNATSAHLPSLQGENLIELPELVPKTYIPYALQAKKMDMKKLKIGIWKTLVSDDSTELIANDNVYKKKVKKTTFSDIYKNLPTKLSDKMRQELSCPLAFVALLHLCNEQDLILKQSDIHDFSIEKMDGFKPE